MKYVFACIGLVGLFPGLSPVAAADRYDVSPAEHAACDSDATVLCSNVQDQDQLLACMRQHRNDLSQRCATVFAAGLKKRGL